MLVRGGGHYLPEHETAIHQSFPLLITTLLGNGAADTCSLWNEQALKLFLIRLAYFLS